MSSNQSSYRPALAPKYGGWREREAAKQRAREEADRLRKEAEAKARLVVTETNFPTLVRGGSTQPVEQGDVTFADLAQEWKIKDDITEMRELARAEKERKERILTNGVYIMSRAAACMPEERMLPTIVEPKRKGPAIDVDGFEVVENRKQRKEKRELTEAELARKYAEAGSDSEEDERTQNEHLFESYRRDHY